MISLRKRSVRVFASAVMATSGLGALALINASTTAHADPQYEIAGQPIVGVGSDTIQDLFNAYSGAEPSQGAQPAGVPHNNTVFYTPATGSLAATPANNSLGIASFDALNPHLPYTNPDNGDFITTKLNGPTFDRPNGSGDGRKALEAAITTGGTFSNLGQTPVAVGGQIDFARSSSLGSSAGPSTSPLGSDLQYIPFAADGVGYAYICTNPGSAGCTAVANLSATDLANLFSGNGKEAPANWGGGATGENLAACGIQTGSGTFQFFLKQLGLGNDDRANADGLLSAPGASGCHGLEENNLDSFKSTVSNPPVAAANTNWVFPTSIGNDIAQHNLVSLDRSSTFFGVGAADQPGFGLAGVGGGALPYMGDGTTTWSANDAYYSGTFGRWVFVVVPTKAIQGGSRNKALVDIFFNNGTVPALCSTASKALMDKFGFDSALPSDATYTGGTCGVPAFQGTN